MLKELTTIGTINRVKKPVRRIDTGAVYPSAASASRALKLHSHAVAGAIYKGHRVGKTHWEYVEDNILTASLPRPIRRLDTGQVYPSISFAASSVKRTISSIYAALRYGTKSAKTYWEYVDD